MKKILIAVVATVVAAGAAFGLTVEATGDIDAAQYRAMAMRSAIDAGYRADARLAMADGRVTRIEFMSLSRGRQPASTVTQERALLADVLAR